MNTRLLSSAVSHLLKNKSLLWLLNHTFVVKLCSHTKAHQNAVTRKWCRQNNTVSRYFMTHITFLCNKDLFFKSILHVVTFSHEASTPTPADSCVLSCYVIALLREVKREAQRSFCVHGVIPALLWGSEHSQWVAAQSQNPGTVLTAQSHLC